MTKFQALMQWLCFSCCLPRPSSKPSTKLSGVTVSQTFFPGSRIWWKISRWSETADFWLDTDQCVCRFCSRSCFHTDEHTSYSRCYRSYRIKKRICRLFQIFLTGRHCFVKIHLHSMFDSTRLINLSMTSVNKSVLDYCESDIMKCDAVLWLGLKGCSSIISAYSWIVYK